MINWLDVVRRSVPVHRPSESILQQAQAAVLMAFTDDPHEPRLILTQRASHLSSHAGEVAFPGGKRDPDDPSLEYTALRESQEEIRLDPNIVDVIGPMPEAVSKAGLQVVPYVAIVPRNTQLVANEDEIESIFQVPIDLFMASEPVDYTEKSYQGVRYFVPCYRFEGYEIWGLTAHFIINSFDRMFETGFQLRMPNRR